MTFEATIGEYRADEALIEATRRDGRARVRIYQPPEVQVVLGRGSKAAVELDFPACQADDVPVLRRRGGGCSVVLDRGNVIVSLAAPAQGFGRIGHYFAGITAWLTVALATVGVAHVEQRGISDLVVGDRKIGGSCLYRERKLLYYSTTLLVTADISCIERYLRHPPREPDYRKQRRHRDFVVNLADLYPLDSARSLIDRLEPVLLPPTLD